MRLITEITKPAPAGWHDKVIADVKLLKSLNYTAYNLANLVAEYNGATYRWENNNTLVITYEGGPICRF